MTRYRAESRLSVVPDGCVPGPLQLRQGVLAVSVLHDMDVEPGDDGVGLPGSPPVQVSWAECRLALAGYDPASEPGRRRLADWLRARRWAADLPGAGAGPHWDGLDSRLRPVGLPVDHVLHPGDGWVQEPVLGGALDLGFGAVGLDPGDPDAIVPLPLPALAEAGIDAAAAWLPARAELEDLGRLAVDLLGRDAQGRLRPVGDLDVVTLLGAASLRSWLAGANNGMAAVIVPMRRRGWTRLNLIDPAFGAAAAAATDVADRGFVRPLLVTADEVTVVPDGGRPELLVLRQPAADPAPWGRTVQRS